MADGCEIGVLDEAELEAARAVLAASCAYDRASEVAREKLFGPAAAGPARAWGARVGGALVGVAAATADRVRVIAVVPGARGRGIGGALLAEVEAAARAAGARRVRTLDLPGNYLAPGIDVQNALAIGWMERRGYRKTGENTNLLIDVRGNPRIERVVATRGYEVRRARGDEAGALGAAIAAEFGGAWPFEVARALDGGGVWVAVKDGEYAAFAAHDGNNQGLGWFGPAGTWAAHRGRGLGEAVLLQCLREVAAAHPRCEVAWVGPRRFYEQCAGVAGERRFAVLTKDL